MAGPGPKGPGPSRSTAGRGPARAFAHLLNGPRATWQEEFSAAPDALRPAGLPADADAAVLRAPDGADWLVFTRTLRAPAADGTGGVVLHAGIPLNLIATRAWQGVGGQVLLVWAMGLVVIGLVAFMLLRWGRPPPGLTLEAESGAQGRTLRLFGLEAPVTATRALPVWEVIAGASLPIVWWGLITAVLGQPVRAPFILMLLPVLLASWWLGLFGGLTATFLAVAGAWDLGTDSAFLDWTAAEPIDLLAVFTLILTGLLVTFSQEAIRRRGAQLAAANERKAAEAMLLAEARKSALILQTASDGVHVLDPEGNVVLANDAFAASLGYTVEEAHRLNVRDWDAQIPREEIQGVLDKLFDSPESQLFETLHRRKDGSVADVEVQCRAVTIEGRRLLYASSRDITQRKRVEGLARAAREQAEARGSRPEVPERLPGGHEPRNPHAAQCPARLERTPEGGPAHSRPAG